MRRTVHVAAGAWALSTVLTTAITVWPPLDRAMPILAILLAIAGTTSIAWLTARLLPAPLAAYFLGRIDHDKDSAGEPRERLRVVR